MSDDAPITTCNGKLALALSKAQAAMRAVKKDASAPIGREGQKRQYATLAAVIEASREALAANELAVLQKFLPSEPGTVTLETVLRHSSGESDSSYLTLQVGTNPGMNPLQALGSAISYARRYSLSALLCIATEEDDDGAGAGQAQTAKKPQLRVEVSSDPSAPPQGTTAGKANGSKALSPEEAACRQGMTWLKAWMVECGLPDSGELRRQIAAEAIGANVESMKGLPSADWATIKAHCQSLTDDDINGWRMVAGNAAGAKA